MYHDLASQLRGIGAAGIDFLTEFVFPPTCAGCNGAGHWLCPICCEKLDELTLPSSVGVPGDPSHSPFELHARFAYREPVRRAIHLLKYERQRARAEWFAQQLAPLAHELCNEKTVLQPVPLTARRQRGRGFNQSTEIARVLAEIMLVPLRNDLSRIRETKPQVELTRLERVANVRGAFSARERFDGARVLLVDDVITTGATMRECAAACLGAGAEAVVGIAVARGTS